MSRLDKLNSLLQQEISRYWQSDMPHIFVTVTKVDVSPDLHDATVWVSFINKSKSNLDALNANLSQMQKSLSQRLRLKNFPRLHLKLDVSAKYAEHIQEIISDLKTKDDHLSN